MSDEIEDLEIQLNKLVKKIIGNFIYLKPETISQIDKLVSDAKRIGAIEALEDCDVVGKSLSEIYEERLRRISEN